MSSALSHKFFNRYPRIEWFLMKVSLVWIWLRIVHGVFLDAHQLPYPAGVCGLFDCSPLLSENTAPLFYQAAVLLSVIYLLEKWMTVTTFLMFVLSLLLFTLEESNGILNRCALYTMVFFAQAVAYYKGGLNLKKNRIQFPVQIVAAGYFLAGTSKLLASGFHWAADAPQASIQILKNYSFSYFDSGSEVPLREGMKQANFVIEHKFFVILLFAFSLFLELTAWVAASSKRNAFIYGCMLFGMHIGIWYFMNILIQAIYYPMLIFLINPLYVGWFILSETALWVNSRLEG